MTALETTDFENQLEVLLEKYEGTKSVNAKAAIEDCIASNLGYMKKMVEREDIPQVDYNHCKILVYLVTAKHIEPITIEETMEEKEERVIKNALDRYADRRKQTRLNIPKLEIDEEVFDCLRLLVNTKLGYYLNYYKKKILEE